MRASRIELSNEAVDFLEIPGIHRPGYTWGDSKCIEASRVTTVGTDRGEHRAGIGALQDA
jgi:hypothetical protein